MLGDPTHTTIGGGGAGTQIEVRTPAMLQHSSAGKKSSAFQQFMMDMLTGGTAAGVSKTCVAPIDRVKLLLQVQNSQKTIAVENRYKGIGDCLVRVFREQGMYSFWRGNAMNVARYVPLQGMNFAFKDSFKPYFLNGVDEKKQAYRFFFGNVASGGLAGGLALCIVYPLDFTRTRLALDIGGGAKGGREFNGITDCMLKIFKTDGPVGFYRGFLVSVQGIAMYRAAYFGLFDTLKVKAAEMNGGKSMSFFPTWAMAQIITVLSALSCYPYDTIRRRMMMQSGLKTAVYSGSWDCVLKVVKQEGFSSLYKGFSANIIRSTGGALVLTFYDEIKKYI